MTSERKRIVVVDGYSTGRELVAELVERGAECLHLRSTEQVPALVAGSFDASAYDCDLGYLGEPRDAVAVLRCLWPDAVVAGSEWGVSFAEEAAHLMGLPTNRIGTLKARRDKYRMIETLHGAGLNAASQALLSSAGEAHAWADAHGRWPIVVKPLDSAGSDGVTICNSHDDIDAAFAKALGHENLMGTVNRELLVQSYLPGPQFVVNTVSWGGKHYVTDVWHMGVTCSGRDVVPQGLWLLDPTSPEAERLIEYTLKALDALGICNGAAHSELKWTPNGPALIETGARLMGAAMDRASYDAAGMATQAATLAQVLLGSDREREELFRRRHYEKRRHLTKLLFNFKEAAIVTGTDGLDRLKRLPSFHAHYRGLPAGGKVHRTADWLAKGGVIYLVHDDGKQIAGDVDAIRGHEARGELYRLRAVGGS